MSIHENPASFGYAFGGVHVQLMALRLEYIAQHGARFLFDNTPPPVPGYPVMRRGKIVRRGIGS